MKQGGTCTEGTIRQERCHAPGAGGAPAARVTRSTVNGGWQYYTSPLRDRASSYYCYTN